MGNFHEEETMHNVKSALLNPEVSQQLIDIKKLPTSIYIWRTSIIPIMPQSSV
jgi:hypothetical protein